MARKADAPGEHARTARDLAPDERQRDGDPDLAFEHVGQEAVLGVVVIVDVAAESELLETRAHLLDLPRERKPDERAAVEGTRQVVEAKNERIDVQIVVDV